MHFFYLLTFIMETGYWSNKSFEYSFCKYMLSNKYIGFQELKARFGACGAALYDSYRSLGFTKTAFSSFQLSERGIEEARYAITAGDVEASLQSINRLL